MISAKQAGSVAGLEVLGLMIALDIKVVVALLGLLGLRLLVGGSFFGTLGRGNGRGALLACGGGAFGLTLGLPLLLRVLEVGALGAVVHDEEALLLKLLELTIVPKVQVY